MMDAQQKKEQVYALQDEIGGRVYSKLATLTIDAWLSKEPLKWEKRTDGAYRRLRIGEAWGGLFDCAWMKLTGTVPEHDGSKRLVLLLDIGGEGLVTDHCGNPVRGITNKTSSYGVPPDKPGKWVVELDDIHAGDEIEYWVDAGCNDLFGYVQNGGIITDAYIGLCDEELKQLYYDVEVLTDWLKADQETQSHQPQGVHSAADVLPEQNAAQIARFVDVLHRAADILDDYSPERIRQARAILAEVLDEPSEGGAVSISAIGHAHLDIAWTWPVREGRRKAARTFASAVKNLERYPDYIFGASQYQLFEWVQEEYPALFERIHAYVKEKRFELQGCFWVEADLNLSGGEALVRQILYGLRYLKDEFDTSVNNLWEPDVFGFTGALPQILVKSGIKYIGSQKLSQNEVNRFPHHLFRWKGIDGSEVVMHNFPEDTYDGRARATSALKLEANYLEKDIVPEALMVYGVGDGGGGPGEEHLERLTRIRNLKGLPKITPKRACDFFEEIEVYRDALPLMEGELYFEKHQGTFSSESRTKKANREMEYALREAEFSAIIAAETAGKAYPSAQLDPIWKETLLYQFHDILPGSSISRVYQESLERYAVLLQETRQLTQDARQSIEARINTSRFRNPCIVYNMTSWNREEWIAFGQTWQKVNVPGMGYAVCEMTEEQAVFQVVAEPQRLENDLLKITFNENGRITSIYDKKLHAEFIGEDKTGNEIRVYHEHAEEFPAWDFAPFYRDGISGVATLENFTCETDGPKAVLTQVYRYQDSTIRQDVTLYEGSRRIDFVTQIDWNEVNTSVKAKFPISVQARDAMCDIQFGAIARPTHDDTSWDYAKHEIPAHKWVDVSDGEKGIALLSNAKYGYRVKDRALEITLLRSQKKPGSEFLPETHPDYVAMHYGDIGTQTFTYSLFPHPGDVAEGQVIKEGYALNMPLEVKAIGVHDGQFKPAHSYFTVDKDNIVIETVKQAEDGAGIIVRLYEAVGKETTVQLSVDTTRKNGYVTNLQEEIEGQAAFRDNVVELSVKPFEIITLKFE